MSCILIFWMTGEGGGCPAESATVCQYCIVLLHSQSLVSDGGGEAMLPARDAATFADNSTSISITAAAASSHPAIQPRISVSRRTAASLHAVLMTSSLTQLASPSTQPSLVLVSSYTHSQIDCTLAACYCTVDGLAQC